MRLTTKIASDHAGRRQPEQARTGRAGARSRRASARSRIGGAANSRAAPVRAGIERGRDRGRAGTGTPRRTATARAVAPPAGSASRVGYSDSPEGSPGGDSRLPVAVPQSRRCMFRPVTSKPDLVAQEHELLAAWRERRTFARLRAQNAGGPRWSFLDGPITANNPMGVHHAWGRAYKDLYQRFHAMLGEDQRYQNGFDCQGLWVEVNVERDLGFTRKRDIEAFGIDRVRDAVQAAGPDLRRPPDRAVDPARDVDGLERPRRAAPARATLLGDGPVRDRHDRGRRRPGDRHASRCSSGGSGCPRSAAATSRSATRTTTSSGASSPSATGAAGCTRATTRCRGARAAGPASRRWR